MGLLRVARVDRVLLGYRYLERSYVVIFFLHKSLTFQYGDYSLVRFDKDEFDMDPTFQPIHVGHTRYVNFYVRLIVSRSCGTYDECGKNQGAKELFCINGRVHRSLKMERREFYPSKTLSSNSKEERNTRRVY